MPYWFDGNNLIGQSAAAAREDPQVRCAFLQQLSTYSSLRGGRFLVFFDGDAADRSRPPRGVQVRYSAPVSADEAILRQIEETRTPAEVIVVTNDHALSAQCRYLGAKIMNWGEFLQIMKNRSRTEKHSAWNEGKVEVDEWLEFFGLDKDSDR